MNAKEFRKEQRFEFDHFQELTSTGIEPNYVNIEKFAEAYHQAKLKLLGIADVVGQSKQFYCANKEWCGIKKGRHCYKEKCEDWSGQQ